MARARAGFGVVEPTTEPMSPDAALLRVAHGDAGAFAELYRQTSARLYGTVLRIVRHRDVAEDVVHDVYLRIWHRAGQFDPERGSAGAWLARIARNAAIDAVRSRRSEAAVPLGDELVGADLPAAETLGGGDGRALAECLERLAANQRTSLLLAYYDGCTHDEIADRLTSPVGTVKSWIRRGLLRLKACLEA